MDDAEAYEFYADPANQVIAGPARKRQGQRLTTMSSVRFAPEVIEAVKDIAQEEGVTVGSWMRRLVQREVDRREPDVVEVTVDGLAEPLRIPGDALRGVFTALVPALAVHGVIDLRIGPVDVRMGPAVLAMTTPVSVAGPRDLIEGSGRRGAAKALPSSLSLRSRSFACPHLSVGNVASVICETCGQLPAAA